MTVGGPNGGRPPWDFGYAPVRTSAGDDDGGPCDVVIATAGPVPPARLMAALRPLLPGCAVAPLLERAPIFWARVVAPEPVWRADLSACLAGAGVGVRYVASGTTGSSRLGLRLEMAGAPVALPDAWPIRAVPRRARRDDEPATPGRWFLDHAQGGVAVQRHLGDGAGTRLAVIDDDAAEAAALDLDAEILVELERAPRSHSHGSSMVAWATGARAFQGVAPGASARLYVIPKPGVSVIPLALAIVRAVIDGADVVVCATYVEGSSSPMLDDALELARRLGRGGKGSLVVVPTGREASSPPGSLHASFSLGLGEPASDPRVLCIAPSARGGGWFWWRDRRKRFRPFANRGPAVRWLAPGDDLAYPFALPERLCHAESSGASAIAAGVLLLVLEANPTLRADEVAAVVTATLTPVEPGQPERYLPVADASDLQPRSVDRDGHNAKHGYGLMNAGRACLAAGDPVAAALVALGEDAAARAWIDLCAPPAPGGAPYSARLGRWAVRALLADPAAWHALRAVVRHLRLVAGHEARREAHARGALLRQLAILVRMLLDGPARPGRRGSMPPRVRAELVSHEAALSAHASEPALELEIVRRAQDIFVLTGARSEETDNSRSSAATSPFKGGAVPA